jgi:hypothetical protein
MEMNLIKNTTNKKVLLTLSTCWYIVKSKFDPEIYKIWINNLLSIVNNFNLVIYTDTKSFKLISNLMRKPNPRIKIIIKPFEEFYTYKYKDFWIKNHEYSNIELHKHIDWKLVMLWNEKLFFVNETIQKKYFTTIFYGWCDIGYFRNRLNDINTKHLGVWPNMYKFFNHQYSYIHYGCVQNNTITYVKLMNDIKKHYEYQLSKPPTIQYEEVCFAGGFFILRPQLIIPYLKIYDEKLQYYFFHNYPIKDDQTILMDIIFTNQNMFFLHTENNPVLDNWFMFQRILL